ncbi:MAG: site-specific DNA-methyltransferase [Nitrospira sp.]|nr:site-specific DNA-methyltransferase [Nitrospira sp.]
MSTKEKRFLDALESLFTGADVDGQSGFVNLMRMKRNYFRSIRPKLMAEIDRRVAKHSAFREELFDKLYTFFSRYFCESGSVYFRHLPAFSRTCERVYADGQDVALSWKTRMLYYVKSDVLVQSMPVTLREEGNPHDTIHVYFDASDVEHKQNNERREFLFAFCRVRKTGKSKVVHLKVTYSRMGTGTKTDDIIRQSRKEGVPLTDEHLHKAIGVFCRQTEADYFINKDARGFLREQFDLWAYQYIFQEETMFGAKRIRQLRAVKDTACHIIDFIAQFEDELRRVWEKPKFVRNVNYVVTLDRLTDSVLKKIARHRGAKAQMEEWQALALVDDRFSMRQIFAGQKSLYGTNSAGDDYRFLPLDTKHFKDLELEILEGLGNLDEALDGELVHSENWQALNSLRARYAGRVQCIHVDPPYNTSTSGFLYRNEYQHSSWLTMMDNRIDCALGMLSEDGSFLCHVDENEYERLHLLMDDTGLRNAGTVIWDKMMPMMGAKGIATQHEYVLWRTRHRNAFYLRGAHVQSILARARELIEKHGGVTGEARREFSQWIDGRRDFSGGERAYRFLDDEGRCYRGVAMGAPVLRTDARFHTPVLHPRTGKPCPSPANGWSRTPETIQALIARGEIIFGKDETVQPQRKVILRKSGAVSTVMQNGRRGRTELANLGLQFPYCHPVSLYEELVGASLLNVNGMVLDCFAGSGTTAHAVINLNREDGGTRKYLLVEMSESFHSVLLPRIKKVVYARDWRDGKPVSREGSSHFLKYYTLEQYEETLRNSRYEDGQHLELDSTRSPFEQYVFFGDDKLAHAVKPGRGRGKPGGRLDINIHRLYPDIDLAESLSHILGKPVRRRTADSVTFEDGRTEKTDPAKMTETEKRRVVSLLKPYLWWGE